MRPSVSISAVRAAAQADRWALTRHARERMGKRRIGDRQLVHALAAGEVVEDYPADPRGPSALVLGRAPDGTPLHAVCAFDPTGALVAITAYVPEPPEPPHWLDEKTRGPGQSS